VCEHSTGKAYIAQFTHLRLITSNAFGLEKIVSIGIDMKSRHLVLIVTLIVISVSLWKFYEGFNSEIVYVRSSVDNRRYLVRNLVRNLDDKQHAADMLAQLRAKLKGFVASIMKHHKNQSRVKRLNIRFKPNNLTESDSNA